MKILKDDSAQALVVAAAFIGLLMLGFLAVALDVGILFRAKRNAQASADAAALAAAEELATGNPANAQSVAAAMAKMNGFDTTLAKNPATVVLQTPASGNFAGSAYVQATVSQPIPTFFLGAFNRSMATVPVSAQAIAGGSQTSQTCVCLVGTSGQTLNMSNNSTLTAPSCGIVVNSPNDNALTVVGSATVNALTLGTVSSAWNSPIDNPTYIHDNGKISSSTKRITGITSQCAPSMPTAPAIPSCVADPGGSWGTFTWGPATSSGTVCYNGLTVGANGATVTLNPGVYVIKNGSLHFLSGANSHSNLGGNGVFFYLTGTASLLIDNGANVNLVAGGAAKSGGGTAPSLGAYDNIVIYQDASDTQAVSLQGGSATYINGALYAPSAAITLGNGSGATIDAGIVASSLTMNGGGTLNAVANTNEGSLSVGSPKLVQ